MKWMVRSLLLIVGLMFLVMPRAAEATNWIWVTSTDYARISIDGTTLRRSSGVISFWDNWEYIDSDERNAMIDDMTQSYRAHGDYTDFSDCWSVMTHWNTYTDSDGTIYSKSLGRVYYDSRGHVIESVNWPAYMASWEVIIPGSIGEVECTSARRYAR